MLTCVCFADEYCFASYNIRVANQKDNDAGNSWNKRIEPLCKLISFNSFDVFGIQEGSYKQIHDILERIGNTYSYFGISKDNDKKKDAYGAIFFKKERFEILEQGNFWLSETPNVSSLGWDGKYIRNCFWCKFRDFQTKDIFVFFNAHLDNVGEKAREEGCKLLLKKIKEIAKSNNFVVAGDFNFSQYSDYYKILAKASIIKDSYLIATHRWTPVGSFCNFKPTSDSPKHLDHIFVSNTGKVSRFGVLNNFYLQINGNTITDAEDLNKYKGKKVVTIHVPSDHYPICAYVKFE